MILPTVLVVIFIIASILKYKATKTYMENFGILTNLPKTYTLGVLFGSKYWAICLVRKSK